MGKKRSAACRAAAAATATAAPAATMSPVRLPDTRIAPVDATPASDAEELLANCTLQPRISHEADVTRVPCAAVPAQPTIDVSLDLESATAGVHATTPVAIATLQTCERHASDPCPEPEDSPPTLTTPTSMSSDVSTNSPQQLRVSNHADTFIAPCPPIPMLFASATTSVVVLVAVIDVLGSPTVVLVCPTHSFSRADDFGHELDALAPRTCPTTSIEEINEDLLANIIEDAQSLTHIEAWCEVRVKALEEGRERGWREGLEEGRREAREDARADMRQQEQGREDTYELGRWDGYCEGLEVARTEVSMPSSVNASVQADVSIPPHSPPADTVPAPARVDTGVQFDAPPLSSPSHAGSPPPIPIDTVSTPLDTVPATSHASADVQTDDHAPTLSPPTSAHTTTRRVHVGIQADAAPSPIACIHAGVQADAPCTSPATSRVSATTETDDPIPTHAISHVNTGVQAADLAPPAVPLSPPNDSHSPHSRVQASMQTDTPCSSAPAHARIVQEIEPGLLTEILAKAIARGEADGLKKGQHMGFQEGFEAGKRSKLKDGHEQALAEMSSASRAIAVVQTDDVDWPARIDHTSQTLLAACLLDPAMVTNISNNSSLCLLSAHDTNSATASTPNIIHSHMSTTISNVSTSHNNLSLSHNDIHTTYTPATSFSWADEPSLLPISSTAPLISLPPRDFSILRSSSARPFDSLKRHARRSQAWPPRPSRSSRPFIPSSKPIVTWRHPAGLRADRPSVIISSSPLVPNLVKLEAPPLDWQGDPRLQELGRVLRGLGWVHVPGS